MKNYIKKIINDKFLEFSINNCHNRIKDLQNEKFKMYNEDLSENEIDEIKMLILDKGKWLIETLILLENIEDNEFYHERQIYNLVNDYVRIESISNNKFYTKDDEEFWIQDGFLYNTNDKADAKHMLKKINKHLKHLVSKSEYCKQEAFDIEDAKYVNRKNGFKMTQYLLGDIELEKLYYISNVLSHNNTRLNKIVDKDKKSDLYKYMFGILCRVFKQLQQSYSKLKKEELNEELKELG